MEKSLYTKIYFNNYYQSFGGEIEPEDFNTYIPNKNRIKNQAEAQKLPEILNKKKFEKKYKNMSVEELRKIKVISNTDGRPSDELTNDKWQIEFNIRKLFIQPYSSETIKLGGKYSTETNTWNKEEGKLYEGCTNWQSYCSFINDILKNIRRGQIDYCYYIYQIMHIAKFHMDTLKTKYCDGYWEVWLEQDENNII